jgi:hypothetical protein
VTTYKRIIEQAYREILDRLADPVGLAGWDAAMAAGRTEAEVREAFIRSGEFADKNPSAGPPPPPPPPPPAGSMTPLKVVGNKLANGSGPVKLLGYIVAGAAEDVDQGQLLGWPLVNERAIDDIARHKLNYTILRLGPAINWDVFGRGEAPRFSPYKLVGDKYDLAQWNDAFFALLRGVIEYGLSKGVYFCASIIDSWVLDHELSPWAAKRNHQGYEGGTLEVVHHAPSPVHERWIRKVASEIGKYPNVIALDGNESFKRHPTLEWVHGIRDIWRDELNRWGFTPKLFGTNSGITEDVDFIATHEGVTLPAPGSRYIIVDEYHTLPVPEMLAKARQAWTRGDISLHYWADGHGWAEREEALTGLQAIVEGGEPTIPDECPPLTRFGVSVHHFAQRGGEQSPTPVVGGKAVLNSTDKFGNPPSPCDFEHPGCGGRPCQDPRGPVWEIEEAPPGTDLRVDGTNPHLAHVTTPAPGLYRVRVRARPDSMDALGKPHVVMPDHSRAVEWTV